MIDIQSPTAENRRGKKEKERRRKIETTAAKYNGPLLRVDIRTRYNKIHLDRSAMFCDFRPP